jgi:hypothetical protein
MALKQCGSEGWGADVGIVDLGLCQRLVPDILKGLWIWINVQIGYINISIGKASKNNSFSDGC